MYCKAGFSHTSLEDCEHVVSQTMPKTGFQLPEGFYSEEAMAARREENRKKYGPKSQRLGHKIRPEVNEAREMR